MSFDVERDLGGGLRYTEAPAVDDAHGPNRYCALWSGSGETPVSSLRLFPFPIRFGAVAVDAEGYGGVQTQPEHRGKGYVRTVLEQSLSGARERVSAVFLYGIEKLYPKVGFVSCLPDSSLTLRVRYAEGAPASGHEITRLEKADLAEVTALYNAENCIRPWTIRRAEMQTERLTRTAVWHPGPEVLVARRGGRPRGYAALSGISFGHAPRSLSVSELVGADDAAALALIGAAARVAWDRRVDSFTVAEPPDSTAGIAARRLGCEVRQYLPSDGSGMGSILDRASLLSVLVPELARREACAESGERLESAEGLAPAGASARALEALQRRQTVPDDRDLLRLLLGFWSWQDAEAAGDAIPEQHRRTLRRWFPGPSPWLPTPHSHQIDHY